MATTWTQARVWWALAVAAIALRLAIALTAGGNGDIDHAAEIARLLRFQPLEVYANQGSDSSWPYLTGYFPLLWIEGLVGNAAHLPFALLQRLPVIAANIGLAWLLDRHLGRTGARQRTRLLVAAILLFGPLPLLESAWHGQIDTVAALLAVGGFLAWERSPPRHRAEIAGGLLGAAIAVKTVPGIAVLALMPHAVNRRELAILVSATVAVPLLLAAPWLLHDFDALRFRVSSYRGIQGVGGLSLIAQPHSAEIWLTGTDVPLNVWQARVQERTSELTVVALAAVAGLLMVRRPRPAVGAVLLFLAVYATAANWALHYFLWILPFLILAGWVRAALLLQIALLVPCLMIYWPALNGTLATPYTPWSTSVALYGYVPIMIALWSAMVAMLAFLFLRVYRSRPEVVRRH